MLIVSQAIQHQIYDDLKNNELTGKNMKRSSQVLILDTNPDIFLEGLKKT
jgi:hypothetical protein